MNPISSQVQMHNNRATLFVNDEPQSPVFYALTMFRAGAGRGKNCRSTTSGASPSRA
jgi:hypothetical protein